MEAAASKRDIVWTPDPATAQRTQLAAFLKKHGIQEANKSGYDALLARADADPEWFWKAILEETGVQFFEPYTRVMDTSKGIEWTQWCVGGKTNAILNCLDRHQDPAILNKDALIWESESGEKVHWTYARLKEETSQLAEGLRQLGCKKGDVIGMYMPMIPQAAVALLAIAKIGGIVLPMFSGFGASAVVSRINDAGAVAILTVDGTWRRGKHVQLKSTIDEAMPEMPTVKHVIVHANSKKDIAWNASTDKWWHDVCAGQPTDSPTAVMDSESPVMVMYTSGTTGKPKGTVFGHANMIIKLAMDMMLLADYGKDDRMMFMSDMGWMVGPLLVYTTTFAGATMVMAEGAHDYPDNGRFWRLIDENKVTFLGIAPTIIRSFMQTGGSGIEKYDLSSLRITLSTGEPWTYDAWMWMFDKVCNKRIPIINYSGGTEIGGGIVTGTAIHPMKPCAFSGPVPGMGVDIVDEHGQSLPRPGTGELVLRKPSIGTTRGLWKDPQRYIESYWGRWPGIWVHGDRAQVDEDGFWYILGRSDDTLKIAGKRTGPSEIETVVMGTGLVAEVAAIGVPDPVKGEALVLVITPMPSVAPNDETRKKITAAVVAGHGSAFSPKAVVFVKDIPKTRNMKIMRRVVKATYLGQPAGDLSSLVNPESLDGIREQAP